MSAGTSTPLSPPSTGPSTQEAPELERNPSSQSGIFANALNTVITGAYYIDQRHPPWTTHMSAVTSSPSSPPSSSPGPITQEAPELERNPSSRSNFFANAQKTVISGGSFNFIDQRHPPRTTHMSAVTGSLLSPSSPGPITQEAPELKRTPYFFANPNPTYAGISSTNAVFSRAEVQKEIPESRKPNSSPLFIGRKDVLDKLGKIFVRAADNNLPSRHSCLLWGAGETGKTQICLKFTEEISERMSHVFWVDASSLDSIIVSLKRLSGIPAAQADSAESALRWISDIQEDWLIVFDNADHLPPDVVAKFIPPGNRGNILINSRNQSMGSIIAFENVIEIRNERVGWDW